MEFYFAHFTVLVLNQSLISEVFAKLQYPFCPKISTIQGDPVLSNSSTDEKTLEDSKESAFESGNFTRVKENILSTTIVQKPNL